MAVGCGLEWEFMHLSSSSTTARIAFGSIALTRFVVTTERSKANILWTEILRLKVSCKEAFFLSLLQISIRQGQFTIQSMQSVVHNALQSYDSRPIKGLIFLVNASTSPIQGAPLRVI